MRLIFAAAISVLLFSPASAQTPLIPQMTSNNAPSGVASASTQAGYGACGAQLAWNAFDRSNSTGWFNDGSAPKTGWLQYTFTSAQTVGSYMIFGAGGCSPMTLARSPSAWQLICQDNGAVLDTRSGITWALNVTQTFTIAAPVSCLSYRLNITNNNGDASYVQVGELQLYAATEAPPPPPPQATKTLGCEGDSQTAVRLLVTAPLTWCAQLAASLGWNYVNFAVGGSKTAEVISRLPTDLLSSINCFVVQIGANDAYVASGSVNYPPELSAPLPGAYGVTLDQYKANLMTIANTIRAKGIPVTFMTPWPFSDVVNRVQFQFFVDAMKDVGDFIGVPVIDAYGLAQGGLWWNYQNNIPAFYSTYYADEEHPTAAAHALEARQFSAQRYSRSCAYH